MKVFDFTSSMETLSLEECHGLLARESTGRVAFADEEFPMILPVNYAYVDGLVAFRTGAGTKLSKIPMHPVAFEVDGDEGSYVWSVLVRGHAREVTTALGARYEELRRTRIPIVASGDKGHWIAIEIADITGRSFASPS